jgi:hypothetical protein
MKIRMVPVRIQGRLLQWRGRNYRIQQVLERWQWRGRWWNDPSFQGDCRTYYRVQTHRGTFELFQRDGDWTLSRELD